MYTNTHIQVYIHMYIFLLICSKYICRQIHKLITLVTYGERNWGKGWKGDFSKHLFYYLNFDRMTVVPFEKIKTASKANNNIGCAILNIIVLANYFLIFSL